MRKLLLFMMFVLAVLTTCALIPWQLPEPDPTPTLPATITPVVITQAPQSPQSPVVTQTPEVPSLPTETALPAATVTTVVEPTSTVVSVPTLVPSPTVPPAPLVIQPGTPRYLPAFPHTDLGCAWTGVAGQIITEDGAGGIGGVVVVSGRVNGQQVEGMALAGSAPGYGPGGYEIDLSAYLGLGAGIAQIRVYDLNGQPLSEEFTFDLPVTCGENLAIITFQVNGAANAMNLPAAD